MFRDDNSLVKGLPRSLLIENPSNRLMRGKRLGTSFVASHVWRKLTPSGEAPRDRLTYSFLPNLVWLPSQLSKLSDREDGFVQSYLQAVSTRVFENVELPPDLAQIVAPIWDRLPRRSKIPESALPDPSELNYFSYDEAWVRRRIASLSAVTSALADVLASNPLTKKVISIRYGTGLPDVSPSALRRLHSDLSTYLRAVRT